MTTKTKLPRSNLPHPLPFHQRRWPPPSPSSFIFSKGGGGGGGGCPPRCELDTSRRTILLIKLQTSGGLHWMSIRLYIWGNQPTLLDTWYSNLSATVDPRKNKSDFFYLLFVLSCKVQPFSRCVNRYYLFTPHIHLLPITWSKMKPQRAKMAEPGPASQMDAQAVKTHVLRWKKTTTFI